MERSRAPAHRVHPPGKNVPSAPLCGPVALVPDPGCPCPGKHPSPPSPGVQTLPELLLAWRAWPAGEPLRKPGEAVGVQERGRWQAPALEPPGTSVGHEVSHAVSQVLTLSSVKH